MDMAAKSEPNTGFPKCETVPMRSNFKLNDGSNGTVCSGSSSNIDKKPFISQGGNANWSVDEEKKLEEGLAKYADEPIVMKYIKIASTLPDKTVRDVALRCKWKIIKQRKPEEHNPENKANNRKDKPVESTCKQYLQSALPPSLVTCACMVHHMDERQHIPYDEFRLEVYKGNNNSRTLEQVRADKQRVSFELELFQSEISRLNSEIDHLRSKVTELSLCTSCLSLILRSLEAYEAELLAIVGVTSRVGYSFH